MPLIHGDYAGEEKVTPWKNENKFIKQKSIKETTKGFHFILFGKTKHCWTEIWSAITNLNFCCYFDQRQQQINELSTLWGMVISK